MTGLPPARWTARLPQPVPWLALALVAGLVYLAASVWLNGLTGFPLDDAWIHQTYARSLAETGLPAFSPGRPSAGSTSPLWMVLLSVGYWTGIPFRLWTYGLGILFLGLTGQMMARLGRRLFPDLPQVGQWAGLFCVLEWHLVWAAVSGMETILFIWLSVWVVEQTASRAGSGFRDGVRVGLLAGLLILTRPEGVVLLGLVGLEWARRQGRLSPRLLAGWAGLAVGALVLLGPYVAFHFWLTGRPLPNTFYAKQAEYAVVLQTFPLWARLFGAAAGGETVQGVFRVVFIGPTVLLLPGLGGAAGRTIRARRVELWLIWAWWLGFLLMYAVRLPVTYQHGRYQIPAVPWLVLLGVWGTVLLTRPRRGMVGRVLVRTLVVAIGLLVPLFVLVGARAYARDVRFIEGQMVTTARWLNTHTPPTALIAAHDIGAVGYFTRREILDLAGLVTPEVIPIIRDEAALYDFIRARGADYLVTFPSWYPRLTRQPGLQVVFQAGSPGEDGMTVYRVRN